MAPEQSVLSALRSVTDVDTTYGGRYVQAIDGLEGSLERARDWLFFVNGIESPLGADDVAACTTATTSGGTTGAGAATCTCRWWSARGRSPSCTARAAGRRSCSADPPLDTTLQALGADVRSLAPAYRVVVGARRRAAQAGGGLAPRGRPPAARGPDGLAAGRPRARLGRRRRARPSTSRRRGRSPSPSRHASIRRRASCWSCAGLDAAAAQAAAQRIADDPAVLQRRYAVAFDGARRAGRRRRTGGRAVIAPLPLLLVGGGLCAALFSTDHPLVLAAGVVAALALLRAAPGPRRGVVVLGLLLAVPVALLNPFVAVEGDLILVPGPSLTVIDLEVTLEELLYGAAIGARLFAVTILTVAVLRLMDADRLQARAARIVPRSALTVALAARLLPVLRGDAVAHRRGRPPARRGPDRPRRRACCWCRWRRRAWSAASTRPRRWSPAATAATGARRCPSGR